MHPSDDEGDFQQENEELQLPPELLLQQAFTGRSVTVNMEQINAGAATQKGASLRVMDHKGWNKVAEVEFPDLPLWFDTQVCSS
jgi:hypothetical protein